MERKGLPKTEIDRLAELYAKGYSATMIMRNLGYDFNQPRSTAIVRRYVIRLGLPRRTSRPVISKNSLSMEEKVGRLESRLRKIKHRIAILNVNKLHLENKIYELELEIKKSKEK